MFIKFVENKEGKEIILDLNNCVVESIKNSENYKIFISKESDFGYQISKDTKESIEEKLFKKNEILEIEEIYIDYSDNKCVVRKTGIIYSVVPGINFLLKTQKDYKGNDIYILYETPRNEGTLEVYISKGQYLEIKNKIRGVK